MKKVHLCLVASAFSMGLFFLLLLRENKKAEVGLSAMESVGKWVVFLIGFLLSSLSLAIFSIITLKKRK